MKTYFVCSSSEVLGWVNADSPAEACLMLGGLVAYEVNKTW
jgi:hypothetical protein